LDPTQLGLVGEVKSKIKRYLKGLEEENKKEAR
jgi:hypothetical protein